MPRNEWGYSGPKLKRDRDRPPKIDEEPEGFMCVWCNEPMYVYKESRAEVIMACNGFIWNKKKLSHEPCPNNVGEHRDVHWRPEPIDIMARDQLRYLGMNWRENLNRLIVSKY